MKVAFLGPAHPFRGGIAQFTQQWAHALCHAGHQTRLFTFTRQFPEAIFPGKTQLDPSPPPDDLEIERVFCAWEPASWLRTARRVAAYRPDRLVAAWWIPMFGPGYAAVLQYVRRRLPEARALISVHNAVPHESWPLSGTLSRLAFSSAHGLLAHSEAVAGELADLGISRRRVRVSPHPTYSHFPAPEESQAELRRRLGITESRVLLFFGYVKRYKGLDLLVDAMPRLLERFGGDLRLLVVGEFYTDRAEHDRQARRLGVEDKITVVDDYVPDSSVGEYFTACDLVVLPYRSATQSGILQVANHFARPVVATQVGELPRLIRHGQTGFLARSDSPEDLAWQIQTYFDSRDEVDFAANIRAEGGIIGWEGLVKVLGDGWAV